MNGYLQAKPLPSPSWLRGGLFWQARTFPVIIGLVLLSSVLCVNMVRFAYNSYLSVIFPGELDYGEGIVWQQARLIPSWRMYGSLDEAPYLVFNYPPLYHLVADALSLTGVSWLAAGRAVSIASLTAIAAISALFIRESSRGDPHGAKFYLNPVNYAAFATGLLIFSLDPLRFWARVARIDMLANALEIAGMYVAARGLSRGRPLHAAAFLFVAAMFTKQTAMVGAIASFLVALRCDPRSALRAAASAGAMGVAAFLTLSIFTSGGFPQHIISYNVNRFSLSDGYNKLWEFSSSNLAPAYCGIAVCMLLILLLRKRLGIGRSLSNGENIIAIYSILSCASLGALGQSGGASNYMIPMVCSVGLLVGIAMSESARSFWRSRGHAVTYVILINALTVQTLALRGVGERILVDPVLRSETAALVEMIRSAPKPVFSEDMVMLMQAGREVQWEPSMITELTATGAFDEQNLLGLIKSGSLEFIVEENRTGNADNMRERYSPAVLEAIRSSYPVVQVRAGKRILFPLSAENGGASSNSP